MKGLLLALAALWLQSAVGSTGEAATAPPSQAAAAPQRFAYERAVALPPRGAGQVCAVLDAAVLAHTEGRLNSLRLYRTEPGNVDAAEVPFALTESGEADQQEEPAEVRNLTALGGSIAFDLLMPQRAYTSVELNLAAQNFLAAAHVYGIPSAPATTPGDRKRVPVLRNAGPGRPAGSTDLGSFALFDLSAQGLSRSTTLPLQELTFPVLHVVLTLHPAPGTRAPAGGYAPGLVRPATVPPSRLAQTVYTPVAQTVHIDVRGDRSVASVAVMAHVPLERTRFLLPAGYAVNFSRDVRVTGSPKPESTATRSGAEALSAMSPSALETISGRIQQVTLPAGEFMPAVHYRQLAVESVLSANLRSDAEVTAVVENGALPPLPFAAVAWDMRQRKLCFDAGFGAPAGTTYALLYGTARAPAQPVSVPAPVYDYARLFRPAEHAATAVLGPEVLNPVFVPTPTLPRPSLRGYAARHPEVLWVALMAAVAVAGMSLGRRVR